MTKEELQALYFGFYDKLNEPERSQAKENWEYTGRAQIPNGLVDAVGDGFLWSDTPEGFEYWDEITRRLESKTYLTNSADLTLTINNLTDSEVTAYMGINNELRKAEAKHPDWPTHDLYKQLAIITEEVGEVSRAIQNLIDGKGTIEELREEVAQMTAMGVRMLKNLKE